MAEHDQRSGSGARREELAGTPRDTLYVPTSSTTATAAASGDDRHPPPRTATSSSDCSRSPGSRTHRSWRTCPTRRCGASTARPTTAPSRKRPGAGSSHLARSNGSGRTSADRRLGPHRRGPRVRRDPDAVAGRKITPLGDAIAHYGRIAKTLHILRLADEPGYRRQIEAQANLQEGRHALARKIFHGRQLYQRYQDGMEDQIGALGLVLNAVVLFNTRYMDAAVNQLRADGFDVRTRMSPASPRSSGITSTCSVGTLSAP